MHQTAVAVHKKGSVNAHFENVYVWDKCYIHLYTLVYMTIFVLKFNGIKFVFAVTYHSYNLVHICLKGYRSQKSIDFLLNPFCIKLVTIYLKGVQWLSGRLLDSKPKGPGSSLTSITALCP